MSTIDGLKRYDTFLSKLDTFKRKKRDRKEVEELTKESSEALQNALSSLELDDPNDFKLQEGEERSVIEKKSLESPNMKQLCEKLIQWLNNVLSDERIIVRDLREDLHDGQILQMLVEKLGNLKLSYPELTQSEAGQLQRLKEVLNTIDNMLRTNSSQWTPERIHKKDLVAILHLLVSLSRVFNPTLSFPPGTFLTIITARKVNNALKCCREKVYITDVMGSKPGLLNGYFVPFYAYHITPTSEEMRLANVRLAFELIESAGVANLAAQPDEIVAGANNDRPIIRLLYCLWSHYTQQLEPDTPDVDNLASGDEGMAGGYRQTASGASRGKIDYIAEVEEEGGEFSATGSRGQASPAFRGGGRVQNTDIL